MLVRRRHTPFLRLQRQCTFALHSFLVKIIQHIALLTGLGDRELLLMMGETSTTPEGEFELGGVTVRVNEGVSEMVLVEDGAAVMDLERLGVAAAEREIEPVRGNSL